MTDEAHTLDLIQRAKAGDKTAMNSLFERYLPRILAAVRMRMKPEHRQYMDVEDVVQSIALQAYTRLAQFEYRGESSFINWLRKMIEHKIADKVRHNLVAKRDRRKEKTQESDSKGFSGEFVDYDTPSKVVIALERFERIEEALDKLPPDYREAIIFSEFEGQPIPEIARQLSRTEDATRMLVKRALNLLFKEIEEGKRENE